MGHDQDGLHPINLMEALVYTCSHLQFVGNFLEELFGLVKNSLATLEGMGLIRSDIVWIDGSCDMAVFSCHKIIFDAVWSYLVASGGEVVLSKLVDKFNSMISEARVSLTYNFRSYFNRLLNLSSKYPALHVKFSRIILKFMRITRLIIKNDDVTRFKKIFNTLNTTPLQHLGFEVEEIHQSLPPNHATVGVRLTDTGLSLLLLK